MRLPRAWRLTGTVTRPAGASGPAFVLRRERDGRWVFGAVTDKAGKFELRGLPEGPWTLAASATYNGSSRGPEITVADASSDVALVLDAPPQEPTPPVPVPQPR